MLYTGIAEVSCSFCCACLQGGEWSGSRQALARSSVGGRLKVVPLWRVMEQPKHSALYGVACATPQILAMDDAYPMRDKRFRLITMSSSQHGVAWTTGQGSPRRPHAGHYA